MSLAISFVLTALLILAVIAIVAVGVGYLRLYGHGRSPRTDRKFNAEVWRALALQSVHVSEPAPNKEPAGWCIEGEVTNGGHLTLERVILHCMVVDEPGPLLAFIDRLGPGETRSYRFEAPHLRDAQVEEVMVIPAKTGVRDPGEAP